MTRRVATKDRSAFWRFGAVVGVAVPVVGSILFATILLVQYSLVSDTAVPVLLPDSSVEVDLRLRGSLASGSNYHLTVRNPQGRLSVWLWHDWGPAHQSNYYRTPEGWLAVLGGGGLAALVELPRDDPPRSVDWGAVPEDRTAWSRNWEYLGTVLGRPPRFYAPSEMAECYRLYGAEDAGYRTAHTSDC